MPPDTGAGARAAAIGAAFLALALIGLLDYWTGYELSFAVFYLAPVGVTAWYATRPWALLLACASSAVWYTAEIAAGYPYQHAAIPIWNAFVRFVFFLVIALLLIEIRRRSRVERSLARSDPLTGLYNSRAFRSRLEHDLALAGRTGEPLTVAYLDLDDFKQINDGHGHSEGDRFLCSVARTLASSTRRSDTVARLGGDEFALILPGTDLESARWVIGKLTAALATGHEEPGLPAVKCSIGAVVFETADVGADEAIAAADRLMYQVKRGGKNALMIERHSAANAPPTRRAPARGTPAP